MFLKRWYLAALGVSLVAFVACQKKTNSGDSPTQRIQVAQDAYNRCISNTNVGVQLACDTARPSGNINVISVHEYSGGGAAVNPYNAYNAYAYNNGLTNLNATRNYNYFKVYIPSLSDSDLNALITEWNYIAQTGVSRTQSLNPVRPYSYPGYSYPGYYP